MDHAARRARLAERFADLQVGALLVTRLPNVRYLAGFSGSNGQLVLGAGDGVFLTDGRYQEQSRREVPDLRRVTYPNGINQAFATACADLGVDRVAFESEGVTYRMFEELSETGIELVPTNGVVEALRWVKDPEELERLRTAQAITDAGFDTAIGSVAAGMTERQLAFALERGMHEAGADGLAFDSIVAFGENAAEPHHSPTERPLRRGDVVKMDFGALSGGYHADMTRTVAFGEPPGQLREIHAIVRQAQQAGIAAVRAGVTGGEADHASREVIREAGFGEAYTHSLGHGVGLEIHEPPWLKSGGEHVLPEGTIVTVEPGIYLQGVGGVRIEDMVEVTADGCRVMPSATKDLIVL